MASPTFHSTYEPAPQLYSLELGPNKTPSELFARIKLLEEQIDATKLEFTTDKRTLLALTMGVQTDDRYGSLVDVWQAFSDMTAERARQMLLEEEQIQKAYAEPAVGEHCGYCNTDAHTEKLCPG